MMMEEIGIQEAANRELLETWSSLEKEFVEKAVLDAGLLEQVKRTLMQNDEMVFQTEEAVNTGFDARTEVAISFARLVVTDRMRVGKTHVELLKQHFSEEEIVVLCAFIHLSNASSQFRRTMNLLATPALQQQENIFNRHIEGLDGHVVPPVPTGESPYTSPVHLKKEIMSEMPLEDFRNISDQLQEIIILQKGSFIDSKNREGKIIALYDLYDFFVEVTFEMVQKRITRIQMLEEDEKIKKWK